MIIRQRHHRRRRLQALHAEHGIAAHCDLELDAPLPRWALVETHVGPGTKDPWWTLGGDWRELLRESSEQLHSSDWPATRLFDLDTRFSTAITDDYRPTRPPDDARTGRRRTPLGSLRRSLRRVAARLPVTRRLVPQAVPARRMRAPRSEVDVASRLGSDHEVESV